MPTAQENEIEEIKTNNYYSTFHYLAAFQYHMKGAWGSSEVISRVREQLILLLGVYWVEIKCGNH